MALRDQDLSFQAGLAGPRSRSPRRSLRKGRQKLLGTGGFWHTEIGPLNQIHHVWGYKNLAERTRSAPPRDRTPYGRRKSPSFIMSQTSDS